MEANMNSDTKPTEEAVDNTTTPPLVPVETSETKEEESKKDETAPTASVATQVSSKDEPQNGNMNIHTNANHAHDAEGHEGSISTNPLFKLVNAAASILQPEKKENEGPKNDQVKVQESSKDQEMTEAKTTNASTDASGEKAATEASPSTTENSTPSSTEVKQEREGTPPNVLKGTKEDLMLDPKIKISFAEHLYNVLENEEHHDVLQWMPDGKAFTVVNHKKFVLQKMPNLFQIRNMSSFVRKLGRWGFSRVFEKETNNSDVFKHPKFIRGDRSGVRKHVKCLGRAAGQASKQNSNNGSANNHLPRQPDFVVRQEPGKPPMVMPTRPGVTVPPGVSSMMLQQHHQQGGFDFRQPRSLSGSSGFPSSYLPSSLDEVTNASAASAEALYLSHQQSQKAKMEQLAHEQQRLEDMEIERLMKRREMRQQQKMQQRLFLEHRQRVMMETGAGASATRLPPSPRMAGGSTALGNSSSSSQHMDASAGHTQQHSTRMIPPHDPLHSNTMPQGSNSASMDLRRVSMQHGSASLDGSLGRSASSRYSLSPDSPAQVTPTYDTRKVLSAAYDTLQRDELRSRERQAAIRALLAEEQEFEARRRAAYGGTGGAGGAGAMGMNHHPSAAAPYMLG